MRSSLPSGSRHKRTVLSIEEVASSVHAELTPMREIIAVCMPGSMRRMGSCVGGAGDLACCASAGLALSAHATMQMNANTRKAIGFPRK